VEGACDLSLGGAARLGEENGKGKRPVGVNVVRGCPEVVFPVEKLVLTLACRPCVSLSALQAR
jgi:hypothetical protein